MNTRKRIISILLIMILLLENSDIVNASNTHVTGVLLHDYVTPAQEQENLLDHGVYTMKYHLNGGNNSWLNVLTYTKNQLPIQLHAPTKDGFTFEGWYEDRNFSEKIEGLSLEDEGLVSVYAKWSRSINNISSIDNYSYKTNFLSASSTITLKNLSYTFLKKVDIPGMPTTGSSDYIQKVIESKNQVPQGLTITSEFILVTAYSSLNKKTPGALFIFSREKGTYLSTIQMKAGSHLGGITFDGSNVWICHSENMTLEKIPYNYIQKASRLKISKSIDVSNASQYFKINNRPSCVTYHNGKIFVATQSPYFDSEMVSYQFNGKKLIQKNVYMIPKNVQGVTFNDDGRVFLSTSFGRRNSSYLRIYKSLATMNQNTKNTILKVEMPPCSEEVDIYDEKLYVIFESAGTKYFEGTDGKGTSVSPIDKILSIKLTTLQGYTFTKKQKLS